jgi:hypothetical protein
VALHSRPEKRKRYQAQTAEHQEHPFVSACARQHHRSEEWSKRAADQSKSHQSPVDSRVRFVPEYLNDSDTVGKTATLGVPPGSSGGKTATNTTATVNVPGVINLGTVTSTSTSYAEPGFAEVTTTNETAGLNLFNGTITADALKVVSTSKKQNGVLTRSMKLTFVNLKVAGQQMLLGDKENHFDMPLLLEFWGPPGAAQQGA